MNQHEHKNKKQMERSGSRSAWTANISSDGGYAASVPPPPPPPPQQLPSHPYRTPRGEHDLPRPPSQTNSYHSSQVVSCGDEAARGGSGSGGGGSGGRRDIGSSDNVVEADEERGNIPYRESRFSPRRGRRKREAEGRGGEDDGDGGEHDVDIAGDGRESPACERLFELGDRAQR